MYIQEIKKSTADGWFLLPADTVAITQNGNGEAVYHIGDTTGVVGTDLVPKQPYSISGVGDVSIKVKNTSDVSIRFSLTRP